MLVELELGVAEGPVAEVVDGGRGAGEVRVEDADGLGPVAPPAYPRQLRALRPHDGGARRRRPVAGEGEGNERWEARRGWRMNFASSDY